MRIRHIILACAGTLSSLVLMTASAAAHVVVRPDQALTGSFQTFTVSVSNEKDQPATALKLELPSHLSHVSPTVKPGWTIDMDTNTDNSQTIYKSITWHDGAIPANFRDEFTFSAKLPDEPADLEWKAYQTYADGTVIAWDTAESKLPKDSEAKNIGPFSVTHVTSQTGAASTDKSPAADPAARHNAQLAIVISLVALGLSLAGLYLALNRQRGTSETRPEN
jgi:uncharacterized protein YcnI